MVSVTSVAPTLMVPPAEPTGLKQALVLAFPALVTTVMPAAIAAFSASMMPCDSPAGEGAGSPVTGSVHFDAMLM
ncbi:hypothetical protein OG876_01375 [Kribbella sp. NBC_00359]